MQDYTSKESAGSRWEEITKRMENCLEGTDRDELKQMLDDLDSE